MSQNNLSGPLLPALPSSLSTFNVFVNNFSGAIPTAGQHDTFRNNDYLPGNPDLGGNLLRKPCAGENVDSLHIQVRVPDCISFPGFGIEAAGGFCIIATTALLWAPARHFVSMASEKRKAWECESVNVGNHSMPHSVRCKFCVFVTCL